jgi:hypothetical protein
VTADHLHQIAEVLSQAAIVAAFALACVLAWANGWWKKQQAK